MKKNKKIYPESKQFYGHVTDENIKSRTEIRFGLPRSNPYVDPIQTVQLDTDNPVMINRILKFKFNNMILNIRRKIKWNELF